MGDSMRADEKYVREREARASRSVPLRGLPVRLGHYRPRSPRCGASRLPARTLVSRLVNAFAAAPFMPARADGPIGAHRLWARAAAHAPTADVANTLCQSQHVATALQTSCNMPSAVARSCLRAARAPDVRGSGCRALSSGAFPLTECIVPTYCVHPPCPVCATVWPPRSAKRRLGALVPIIGAATQIISTAFPIIGAATQIISTAIPVIGAATQIISTASYSESGTDTRGRYL